MTQPGTQPTTKSKKMTKQLERETYENDGVYLEIDRFEGAPARYWIRCGMAAMQFGIEDIVKLNAMLTDLIEEEA